MVQSERGSFILVRSQSTPSVTTLGKTTLYGIFSHRNKSIPASGGEKIDATLGQLCGLGLREGAAIANHDPILHLARERIQEFTIIDGGDGEIETTEPSRLIALDVPLKALPRWESRYQ